MNRVWAISRFPTADSHSTFIEKVKKIHIGLFGCLKSLGRTRVFLCGLAFDYCVYYSAKNGVDPGFDVAVAIDFSKVIGSPLGHLSNALDTMTEKGVLFIESKNIATK